MTPAAWVILALVTSIPVWVWIGIQIGRQREHDLIMAEDREWERVRRALMN